MLLLFEWVLRICFEDLLVFAWVLRGTTLKPVQIPASGGAGLIKPMQIAVRYSESMASALCSMSVSCERRGF